jgi:hypothetical protein
VLSDVYWHVPYADAIAAETGSVEWICMYSTKDACIIEIDCSAGRRRV